MKFFIEIGHPANVHYFKNFIFKIKELGHSVIVIARDSDVTFSLLESYGIVYISRGKGKKSLFGKLTYLIKVNVRLLFLSIKEKPDFHISMSSPYALLSSFFSKAKYIVFDDTEVGKFEQFIYKRYADNILTPIFFNKYINKKHQKFNGFMELFYLHPDVYKPSLKFFNDLKIEKEVKYVLIRLVSWEATHDINESGLNEKDLRKVISLCEKHGYKVFISAQGKLHQDFLKYELKIEPHLLHDLLYYASLYIGEGATTASECVMLGTPAVYINSIDAGTIEEQTKSGLLSSYRNYDSQSEKEIERILRSNKTKDQYLQLRDQFLSDKLNMTEYLVDIVENYYKL